MKSSSTSSTVGLVISVLPGVCTGDFVCKPNSKLPYSKVKARGISIEGLPGPGVLKHSSSYGRRTLLEILKQKDQLRLKSMY